MLNEILKSHRNDRCCKNCDKTARNKKKLIAVSYNFCQGYVLLNLETM